MGDWDIAGRARGNVLSWVTEITKPMSMKVTFEIAVDGDTITGTAKMGFLGNAKLKGERIAPSALSAESRAHQNVTVGLVTGDSIDPQFNDAGYHGGHVIVAAAHRRHPKRGPKCASARACPGRGSKSRSAGRRNQERRDASFHIRPPARSKH